MKDEAICRAICTTHLLQSAIGVHIESGQSLDESRRKVLVVQCADMARNIVRLSELEDDEFYVDTNQAMPELSGADGVDADRQGQADTG